MPKYISKKADLSGQIHYTPEENETWHILVSRQMDAIQDRACAEFLEGLETLNLPVDRVPQCTEVTRRLQETTGWSVKAVPALISINEFFTLLAHKQFPAATFIRRREELDYLKEPDIFHEFFGHCPLLTNQAYADFVEWYGKTSLKASNKVQSLLGRLFWFTIEFGLIKMDNALRIYGGGILSSYEETFYALESNSPERKKFDLMDILNTNYRYDEIQKEYFILNKLDDLYQIQDKDIIKLATVASEQESQVSDFNVC